MRALSTLLASMFASTLAHASPFAAAFSNESFIPVSERALVADPRFAFDSIGAAFTTARPMTVDETLGDWTTVGMVTNPVAHDPDSKEFYSPDGRFASDGLPGYFFNCIRFSALTDTIGSTVYNAVASLIGAETGRVYYTEPPQAVHVSDAGLFIDSPAQPKYCKTRAECRIAPNALMICQLQMLDEREPCARAIASGQTLRYVGNMKSR